MSAIGFVVIGFFVAMLARLLIPAIMTLPRRMVIASGMLGAMVGGVAASLMWHEQPFSFSVRAPTGLTFAFIGAGVMVLVLRAMSGPSSRLVP